MVFALLRELLVVGEREAAFDDGACSDRLAGTRRTSLGELETTIARSARRRTTQLETRAPRPGGRAVTTSIAARPRACQGGL
jgi:hypothetical protein